MSKERIVGIDFGTSTSVVRVKNYYENGKPIGDELFTESVKFNQGASMVPSAKLKAFLSNFDRDSWQSHRPIFYYDASTVNGKKGFLITNKAIFQYEGIILDSFQIDIQNISCIEYNKTSNDIYITEKDGLESKLYIFYHTEPSIRWITEFLNKLVKYINKSKNNAPVNYNGNDPVEYAKFLCRNNKTPLNIGNIGEKISMGAVNNFLSYFDVRDRRSQKPIYFHNATLFGSGKNGILLTNTTLFRREGFLTSYSIDIQNIREFILTDDKQGHKYLLYDHYPNNSGVYSFFKNLIEFIQNSNK